MKVYQTDGQGHFVCVTTADADPLNPTEWLIPAGCVTTEPHIAPEGAQVKWDGYKWVNEFPEPEAKADEPEPLPKDVWARGERDKLLNNTDWTQVLDAPVDKAAWATYRQALRDVPAQAGFPDNVTWPTEPE